MGNETLVYEYDVENIKQSSEWSFNESIEATKSHSLKPLNVAPTEAYIESDNKDLFKMSEVIVYCFVCLGKISSEGICTVVASVIEGSLNLVNTVRLLFTYYNMCVFILSNDYTRHYAVFIYLLVTATGIA